MPGQQLSAHGMCRAVGEYAGQQGQGEEGSAAVTAFFKALEAYDYVLLQVGAPPPDLLSRFK